MLLLFAQETQNQNRPLRELLQFLETKGREFGLNLLVALAIFFIGKWVVRILTGWIQRWIAKGQIDETLSKFVGNLIYGLMMTFVVLAALDRLGLDTTSLAAVMAAAGLAIGLALQGSLSNFAAGFLIILFRPFRVGDYVQAGGTAGTVVEVHILHTILKTPDNVRVVVPNGKVAADVITNYSVNENRRIDLIIGCGYDDDLKEVKSFLQETITSDERVLKDPEPVVAVHELGDNSVNFVVRPWVKTSDYWKARWDLLERIKLGFDERGFSIPYPQQDVHLHQTQAG